MGLRGCIGLLGEITTGERFSFLQMELVWFWLLFLHRQFQLDGGCNTVRYMYNIVINVQVENEFYIFQNDSLFYADFKL